MAAGARTSRAHARPRRAGIALLIGGLLGVPAILACGGGEEEGPRPVAHAATDHGSGTYWGGGASAAPTPPMSGSVGMRVGGGGGGGALADAMRRRREDRRREMREGLGPTRLTEDGSELWPVFEPAVRRMAEEVGRANIDDPCEETLLAGEVLVDEVTGSHRPSTARDRRNCRAIDEVAARCASEEYVEAHHEECDPVLARGERVRRAMRTGNPDPDVVDRAMASGRASARRAGYGTGTDDETPPPVVLPDLDIPSRGDGVSAN